MNEFKPKRSSLNRAIIPVFIIVYSITCFLYGMKQNLNWDEKASIDIAMGIRPELKLNDKGYYSPDLDYRTIIKKNNFTSRDYEKQNTIKGIYNSVMNDTSNSFPYYVLIHFVIKLCDLNLSVLRLLTIIMSAINLWMFYRLVLRADSVKLSTVILIIVLLACNVIYFKLTYLIRGYMFSLFFCLLATGKFLHIYSGKVRSGNYILFTIYGSLAVLLHYFSLHIILCQFMLLGYASIKSKELRQALSSLVAAFFIFVCILATWVYFLYPDGIRTMQIYNKAIQALPSGYNLGFWNYAKVLFNSVIFLLGNNFLELRGAKTFFQLLGSFSLILIIIHFFFSRYKNRVNIFLIIAVGSLFFYSIQSLVTGHFINFVSHYLVFILPFFIAGVVSLVSQSEHRGRWLLKTVSYIGLLVPTFLIFFYLLVNKNSPLFYPIVSCSAIKQSNSEIVVYYDDILKYSCLANKLKSHYSPGDVIVYDDWEVAHRMNYFLRDREDMQQLIIPALGHSIHYVILKDHPEKIRFKILKSPED